MKRNRAGQICTRARKILKHQCVPDLPFTTLGPDALVGRCLDNCAVIRTWLPERNPLPSTTASTFSSPALWASGLRTPLRP
jgi:hypothetical protein